MDCEYCKKFGNSNVLEHLPAKKTYYCKRCGNYFGEDEFKAKIQAEFDSKAVALAKETAKQLDQGGLSVEELEKKTGVMIQEPSLIVEEPKDKKKDSKKENPKTQSKK